MSRRICGTINRDVCEGSFTNGGVSASFDGERLIVLLRYSFSDTPLTLSANAAAGDKFTVKLIKEEDGINDVRVELYVNGVLCDEEWPCGTIDIADDADGLEAAVSEEEPSTFPAVLSEFDDAEGWCPQSGVFVGDCMPYVDGGRYHVLYLKDRHRHCSKWGLGAHQWEHISTENFIKWQIHPMAVPITKAWEGSICTGSHIRCGDKHYLWYTVRTCDGSPAPIMRSVSYDGYHFEKDESFSFTLSDKYNAASARDPKVYMTSDGIYHMLLTTTLLECGKGCLAHLVSKDLESFKELSPIYTAPDENEPECSDCFEYGGFFYLIFSHHGKGEYRYSESPFGVLKTPCDPTIPCSSVPKAALFKDRIIFAGFKSEDGRYAGVMTFKEAYSLPDGRLKFQ